MQLLATGIVLSCSAYQMVKIQSTVRQYYVAIWW